MQQEPPSVVYMVSYLNDAAMLVNEIRRLIIRSSTCRGAGAITPKKFINQAGAVANCRITAMRWTHLLSHPGTRDDDQPYRSRHSVPSDYLRTETYSARNRSDMMTLCGYMLCFNKGRKVNDFRNYGA